YLRVGDTIRARGSYSMALVFYEKGIHADPRNADLYWRAGEAASHLKQWGKAVRYFQRSISLRPERIQSYTEAADIYILGYRVSPPLQQAAILNELKGISDKLHARFPNSFEDERLAGYVELLSGRPEPALAHFLQARQLHPQDPDVLTRCVELLADGGQVEKAEALVDEGKPKDADAAAIYDAIAAYYLRADRMADLERIARTEIQRNPGVADGYLVLGALEFSAQRWPDMLANLRTVAALGPLGPYTAGDFFLRISDLPRAREQYESGAARTGPFQVDYQKRLVEVLVKQGHPSDAERLAERLLNAHPKDPEAVAIRASITLLRGEARTAAVQFRPLLDSLPQDFVLRFLYGRALAESGNVAAAVLQFKDACMLREDYIWPRIALANLTIDTGNYGDTLLLAKQIVNAGAVNIPFETAGQRPQERPFYEKVLHIRPVGGLPMS